MMPQGLFYIPAIIDADTCAELLQHLSTSTEWFAVGKCKNSRKVIHYGSRYNYGGAGTDAPAPPIPYIIDHLRESLIATVEDLIAKGKITTNSPTALNFDQCIINKYEPGQGIGAHCDANTFDEIIGCFTVCVDSSDSTNYIQPREIYSPGQMEFVYPRDLLVPNYVVTTEHCSLYIMSGESRNTWEHQMVGRRTDSISVGGVTKRLQRATRISITFRSTRKK
jgi:alkylated DNA repair dioxygenase AlkB